MKRIKTTAKKAASNNLINEGDYIFVKCKVLKIENIGEQPIKVELDGISYSREYWILDENEIIITKPKPIDFSVEGRILKCGKEIVKTTGYQMSQYFFSAILIQGPYHKKGECSNKWEVHHNWTDITDTYSA
jgi:hypothetical protein